MKDLFAYVLSQLRGGRTQEELSETLQEAVNRARDTGRKAVLTFELTISPNGDTGQYNLTDKIKSKLPELARAHSLFYGTPEGRLQRTDPAQAELEFESRGEVRRIK